MSLPKWMRDAGADPALWVKPIGAGPAEALRNDVTMFSAVDGECWVFSYKGYTSCRVPDALAPAIIKLIEEHLPKPPKKGEGQALAAELVNCLGPSGLAQFIQTVSTLGEAPTARAVLQCAAHAFRTENGIEGAYAPALQRAERWLEHSKEAAD